MSVSAGSNTRGVARQTPGNEARFAALNILVRCLEQRNPLETAIDRERAHARLSNNDRALVRAITAGTCRHLGQIDNLIDGCLRFPLARHDRLVRNILRMGTAQIVFLGIAHHAAVSTSVDLAKTCCRSHASLVNAVLRRMTREGACRARSQDAQLLNTPDWLRASWTHAYGAEKSCAIAREHGQRAGIDLVVKRDAEDWAQRLGARLLSDGVLRLPADTSIDSLPGYRSGDWWVQDVAASLPVRLMGEIAGMNVLDLCAAPGGKTAQLAMSGARVTAVDISRRRVGRLRDNLQRLGCTVDIVVADMMAWEPQNPADAVLLDAPCSGTGVIRRHPDIPWIRQPDDVVRHARRQRELISRAIEFVKPGGILVYAVCSLQPEESEFLRCNLPAGCRLDPIDAGLLGDFHELVDAHGCLRTTPDAIDGGMDGFFAMRLQRYG